MSTPQGNENMEDQAVITINDNSSIVDNSSINYIKYDRDIRKTVLFWCNLVVFLVALGICVASFTIPSLKNATPRGIAMWQWSMLATVLLGGPLLSKILHYLVIFIDKKFGGKFGKAVVRENVFYYIVELIESAWVVLWFSIVLVAWLWVVDGPSYLGVIANQNEKVKEKFANTFPIITITLIAIIIGSIFWLLKDIVLLMAKSSFHISKFFERATVALVHQHIIDLLPPETHEKPKNPCRAMCDMKEEMPSLNGSQVNQNNVSSWGMQKVFEYLFENKYITYDRDDMENRKEIKSKEDAHEAAKYIFDKLLPIEKQIRDKIKKYIEQKQVQRKDQVSIVMCKLLGGQNRITESNRDEFKRLMVKAFEYRDTLAHALEANKKLFNALNKFIEALLVFFIFALWLMMIRVETRKVIIVIGSAIVGSAVIFGETYRKIMDSLLFVFVVHPFDIGDCCRIDGTLATITKITVLTTTAVTPDNEIRYYPNTYLADKCISNYTRSREMDDFVDFSPKPGIPIENIEQAIKSYIKSKPQLFLRDEHYLAKEMTAENKLKIRLHFKHSMNPHDFKENRERKSNLVLEIEKIICLKVLIELES